MSDSFSGNISVDSDDDGRIQNNTVSQNKGKTYTTDDKDLRESLEEMDKKQLIKLITGLGQNELRHANFSIAILRERMTHFEKAIDELEKSIEFKKAKADKYRNMGDDPQRSIKAIRRIIKNNEKRIEVLQKEVNKFEEKKQKKSIEQQNAKKEITKKLIKGIYKFLEKDSDPIIVKLMENFVAMLRNKPSASKEDVELYIRKYEGLVTALNKVNPREISGGNAKIYTDAIQAIRNEFTGESKYSKYIPILVFLNQTCAMVNLTVEERVIESQIRELENDNKLKEQEIEEIETFQQHVEEIIDYDIQVDQEQKQLALFKNHYSLLQLRYKKLGRYSRFFERYYFDEIEHPEKLRSQKLEKIDTMDDLDKVEGISDQIAKLNIAQPVVKYKREEDGKNPVGSSKGAAKMEKKAKQFEDSDDSGSGDDQEPSDEESKEEESKGSLSESGQQESGVSESKDEEEASSDEEESESQ